MTTRPVSMAGAEPLKALKGKMQSLRNELEDCRDRSEIAEKQTQDERRQREQVVTFFISAFSICCKDTHTYVCFGSQSGISLTIMYNLRGSIICKWQLFEVNCILDWFLPVYFENFPCCTSHTLCMLGRESCIVTFYCYIS